MQARGLAALCAMMMLVACATDPVVPATPLGPITAESKIDRAWKASFGKINRSRFAPFANSEFVVVADKAGNVTSLNRETGKTVWSKDLDVKLGSGVAGDGTQVYVSSIDGQIFALSTATGDVAWIAQASSEVLVPVSAGYGAVVVRSADGRIARFDAATGRERWSTTQTPPALTLNGYSQPYLVDGGVLVGLDDGRLIAINLNTGKTIWQAIVSLPTGRSEVERLVDIDANILTDDSFIYVVNYRGKLARIEPVKGQIQWAVPMSSTAGIAQTDDLLVVVDEFSIVHGVDKASGQTLWIQEGTKGHGLGQPVINNNTILIGDANGVLHGLALNDGRMIARNNQLDSAISNPVISDNVVFVQSSDGTVSALTIKQ